MKLLANRRLMTVLLSILIVLSISGSALAQDPSGYVNVHSTDAHAGPGVSTPLLATLMRGEWVSIIGRNTRSTWLQVVLPANVVGWVFRDAIMTNFPIANLPVINTQPAGPSGYVTANFLNVRTGPSSAYSKFTYLERGQWVALTGRNADASWLEIELWPGSYGWTSARYILTSFNVWNLNVKETAAQPAAPAPTYWPPDSQGGYDPAVYHTVQWGEGLYSIANAYGTTVEAIAAANGIANVNAIYAGQVLRIP